MKKLGNLFVLLGVALLLFVGFTKVQTYTEQQKLIKEYTALNFADETVDVSEDIDTSTLPEVTHEGAIGLLEIPKIDLTTAIVEGAGSEEIKYAVGHLPSSASLHELGGQNQNFAIAGHRSYTYGKHFNRLDELEPGHEITIYAGKRVLTYHVFDKQIVKPTDVHVVNPIEGKSVVTLITCHPERSNKQRLIVFGELVEEKTLDGSEFVKK